MPIARLLSPPDPRDCAEMNSAPSLLSQGAAMPIVRLLSSPDPRDCAEVNSALSLFSRNGGHAA